MDVVKLKGRANKVLVGDCVSVPLENHFRKLCVGWDMEMGEFMGP